MNIPRSSNRSHLRNSLILCLCMMTGLALCSCKRSSSSGNAASGSGSSSSSASDSGGSGSGGNGSSNIIIDVAQARVDSLKIERRKANFKLMYRQIILNYSSDNVLDLPEDIQELATNPRIYIHASIDLDTFYHNAEPIELGGELAKNTILLSDSADLGQGDKRIVLYADGHIEVLAIASDIDDAKQDQQERDGDLSAEWEELKVIFEARIAALGSRTYDDAALSSEDLISGKGLQFIRWQGQPVTLILPLKGLNAEEAKRAKLYFAELGISAIDIGDDLVGEFQVYKVDFDHDYERAANVAIDVYLKIYKITEEFDIQFDED